MQYNSQQNKYKTNVDNLYSLNKLYENSRGIEYKNKMSQLKKEQ